MADADISDPQRDLAPGPMDAPESARPSDSPGVRLIAKDPGPIGTPGFIGFSIMMGIIAPIFCLAVWSFLFPGMDMPGLDFIDTYWHFSHGVIGLEILVLSLWLALADRLETWCGMVCGVLLAGGLFAGVLGLVLLPFSLIGLMALIGALGLVPLFTAYVYFRNALRVYRHARTLGVGARLWAAIILGMTLALGIPGVIEVQVSRIVRSSIRDIADGKLAGVGTLRFWFRSGYWHLMVESYRGEADQARKERLEQAFRTLTGEDIETWSSRGLD